MNLFKLNRIITRLDNMIENAINGRKIEREFDETKMSALETKLNRYVLMNSAKAEELEVEKARMNQLISDISHQTKTPISNLILYSGLLSEQEEVSPYSKQLIYEVVKQSEKLDFLITALIKSSRLENGIISINPTKNSLDELIRDAISQVGVGAHMKGIGIAYTNTGLSCNFDPKWTVEAIYNILDNALKYTPTGGEIHIFVEVYEMFYRINIKDNGIGIEESEQSKIFLRFYRSKNVVEKDGVGIGLYLSREIIERQGGYVKVSSLFGSGSTFSVFLPK